MLTSDLVDVMTGPASSTTAVGVLDKIETNQVLLCSGSNTSPALSPKGTGGGYYLRTAPPDKLQAPATAEVILGDGHANVAVVALNDDYGQGYAKAISKALKQGGAKVVANVAYDPEGDVFDSDAQEVADASPDAVALIAFPETGSKVIQALIAAGVGPADVPLYTTDGLDDSSIPELVDPANLGVLAGTKGTTPAAAPAGIEHPFAEVFAATGVDTVFSSYYYDCAIIMALAAESAETDDPVQIRKHIKKVLKGDTECQTFADCKEALDAGDTINYNGAASEYAKFGSHEPLVGVYDVYTFDEAGEKSTLGDDAQISIP
jgi:branched-chain amino acid transport system substrate-binding protein